MPKTTMKSKLCLCILAAILTSPLGLARAQSTLVIPNRGVPGTTQQIDPTTGLPVSSLPDWKDANWKDPDIVLTNVFYDGLALSEVAHSLSEQFKEQFDVLLPGDTAKVTSLNGQMVPASWETDWRAEPIQLRLKNVSASEIFNAMNLLFENNRTPLRWELKVNGHRQIALLRVLTEPNPQLPLGATAGVEVKRRVYFVGNLIGDEKTGGMSMEQIIKTITDVWGMADASGGNIQFHKEAQLLVVIGTPGQIDFMEQTLKALEEKRDLRRIELAHPEQYGKQSTAPAGK
jgi:hypothetical protein